MAARKSLLVRQSRSLRAGRACSLGARDGRPPARRRACRATASTCRSRSRSSTVDAVTVRKGLTAVTKPSREVAWRGPTRFAARIHETLVELHELVRARHPALRLALRARHPLRRQGARPVQRGGSRHGCPARGGARSAPGRLPGRAAQARRRSPRAWSSWPRRPSTTGCRTRPSAIATLLGDDGLAALDTILTRKLDAMPPDSRAALSHTGLDAAGDERVARSRARRHRSPRARARARPDDAGALRAHRARARHRPTAATTRSTGCSAAWPSTAPATTRCARRS